MRRLPALRLAFLAATLAILSRPVAAEGQIGAAALDSLRTLVREGRAEEVRRGLVARAAADSTNLELLLMAGQVLIETGHPADARAMLARVAAADSRTWRGAWARVHLARSLFAVDLPMEARSQLDTAVMLRATDNATRTATRLLAVYGLHPSYVTWRTDSSGSIRVHHPPTLSLAEVRSFQASRDSALAGLQRFFHAPLPKPIDVFVWKTDTEAAALGLGPLGFADPLASVVHTRIDQTPGHELTHVISYHAAATVVASRLVNEGTAVYFDGSGRDLDSLARYAVRQLGRPVTVDELWSDPGSMAERYFLPLAGAFVGRLARVGGRERLIRLLGRQTRAEAIATYGDFYRTTVTEYERVVNGGAGP